MSVSLGVHRVDRVQIERLEHEGHCWTKIRMVRRDGSEIFAVDVFSAMLGHVEIVDTEANASASDSVSRTTDDILIYKNISELP